MGAQSEVLEFPLREHLFKTVGKSNILPSQ